MTPIEVTELGRTLAFSFEDMLKFHGPGSPGGVAQAFAVMRRAFAVLAPDGPPLRREITIRTSFGGPGARDGFEAVTRAVSGDRFTPDPSLARPELGRERERFVFVVGYRDRSVTLVLREGWVTPEFIDLARMDERSAADEARLDELKGEMAQRVSSADAADVYDLEED